MQTGKEHVCEVCGRKSARRFCADKKVVCHKHYRQYRKHGQFLDSNPRTIRDPNEIRVEGETAYMDLYDKYQNVIGTVIFDAEDVDLVKSIKWKLAPAGYAMNTPSDGVKPVRHFARVVFGEDKFTEGLFSDHINHNKLDNRKENLRVVTKSQNGMNQLHVKGVHETKCGHFHATIKKNGVTVHLGTYNEEDTALWARWYAERTVFGEYAKKSQEPCIDPPRKEEIKLYVDKMVLQYADRMG